MRTVAEEEAHLAAVLWLMRSRAARGRISLNIC